MTRPTHRRRGHYKALPPTATAASGRNPRNDQFRGTVDWECASWVVLITGALVLAIVAWIAAAAVVKFFPFSSSSEGSGSGGGLSGTPNRNPSFVESGVVPSQTHLGFDLPVAPYQWTAYSYNMRPSTLPNSSVGISAAVRVFGNASLHGPALSTPCGQASFTADAWSDYAVLNQTAGVFGGLATRPDFTLAFWVRTPATQSFCGSPRVFDTIWQELVNGVPAVQFQLALPGNALQFEVLATGLTTTYMAPGVVVLPPSTWTHLAVTWELANQELTFYVNGTLQSQQIVQFPNPPSGASTITMFNNNINGSSVEYASFAGAIDEYWLLPFAAIETAIVNLFEINRLTGGGTACPQGTYTAVDASLPCTACISGWQANGQGGCEPCGGSSLWPTTISSSATALGSNGTQTCAASCAVNYAGTLIGASQQLIEVLHDSTPQLSSFRTQQNGTQSWSMTTWIYVNQTAGIQYVMAKEGAFRVRLDGAGHVQCRINRYMADYAESDGAVPQKQWTHIAVTVDITTQLISFYIGGALDSAVGFRVDGAEFTPQAWDIQTASTSNVTFGACISVVVNPLQWILDPVTYPSHVPGLVPCELYALWNSGYGFSTDVYALLQANLTIHSSEMSTDMTVWMLNNVFDFASQVFPIANDSNPSSPTWQAYAAQTGINVAGYNAVFDGIKLQMYQKWPWVFNFSTSPTDPTGFFTGSLDETTLFARTLTPAEVMSLSLSPLMISTAGTVITGNDVNLPRDMVLLLQFDQWLGLNTTTVGSAIYTFVGSALLLPFVNTPFGPVCIPSSSASVGQVAQLSTAGAIAGYVSCAAGYSSWPGGSVCEVCPIGFYSTAGSACTPCPAGSSNFGDGASSSSACQYPPPGSISLSLVSSGGSSGQVVVDLGGLNLPPSYPVYLFSGNQMVVAVSAGPVTPQVALVSPEIPGVSSSLPALPVPVFPTVLSIPAITYPSAALAAVLASNPIADPIAKSIYEADLQASQRLEAAIQTALFYLTPLELGPAPSRRRLLTIYLNPMDVAEFLEAVDDLNTAVGSMVNSWEVLATMINSEEVIASYTHWLDYIIDGVEMLEDGAQIGQIGSQTVIGMGTAMDRMVNVLQTEIDGGAEQVAQLQDLPSIAALIEERLVATAALASQINALGGVIIGLLSGIAVGEIAYLLDRASVFQGHGNHDDTDSDNDGDLVWRYGYHFCQPGTFTNTTGATSCFDCPAGTFANITGATTCYTCPVGTFSFGGAASCSSCPAGTAQPNVGAANYTQCLFCPGGSFSAAPASSTCKRCPANTFSAPVANSSLGATSCTPCAAGLSSSPGSTTCACPAGQYVNQTSGLCTGFPGYLCLMFYGLPGDVEFPWSAATAVSFSYTPVDATRVLITNGTGSRVYTDSFGDSFITPLAVAQPNLQGNDNYLFLGNTSPPVDSSGLLWLFSGPVQLPATGLNSLVTSVSVYEDNSLVVEGAEGRIDPSGSAFLSNVPGFVNTTIGAQDINHLTALAASCQALITFTNGARSPAQPNSANSGQQFNFSYFVTDGETYTVEANLTLTASTSFAVNTNSLGVQYQTIVNAAGTRLYTYLATGATILSRVSGLNSTSKADQSFYPYSLYIAAPGVYSENTAPFLDGNGIEYNVSPPVPRPGAAPGSPTEFSSVNVFQYVSDSPSLFGLMEARSLNLPDFTQQQQIFVL